MCKPVFPWDISGSILFHVKDIKQNTDVFCAKIGSRRLEPCLCSVGLAVTMHCMLARCPGNSAPSGSETGHGLSSLTEGVPLLGLS